MFLNEITPVQQIGPYFVKRDDLFVFNNVHGGKVRTCYVLSQGAKGLVTAGSRSSPQCNIVAHIAEELCIPCHVHTPEGELSSELINAQKAGAKVFQHPAGYNGVIIARAKEDAKIRGWTNIPFGMETPEAIKQTLLQVANIPQDTKRIVVPIGSGMSAAGILFGLGKYKFNIPVLGVIVGADPTNRLDAYAPTFWRSKMSLVQSGIDYHEPASVTKLNDELELDPIYEAKCIKFLNEGDLLWVVGIRQV